ncbi:MAG: glycosyltransferase [Acidimicrobiia bacterium]|nr:glycosyltransferase [Acidimicrobiia bacterium]
MRGGVVSVVIVTEGETDGEVEAALDAVERLVGLDWPADLLESIVVGPRSRIATAAKARGLTVKVVDVPPTSSTSSARNLGAASATGEWLAFLDRDGHPEPLWLRTALRSMRRDANVAAVASKVLDADGSVAFVDAALTFAGEPILPHFGKPDTAAHDRDEPVLYPSPWALVIETKAFRWVGGYDDEHCAGVEHADLGWRLWLNGLHVTYSSESVVRLGQHERVDASDGPQPGYSARGGIEMLYKNLDDASLGVLLDAAVALTGHQFDPSPALIAARARVQASRRLADLEILPLFRLPAAAGSADERNAERVRSEHGVDRLFTVRRRILVATPDVLQPKMAGPAIRAFQMALALSQDHDVELVSTVGCEDISHPAFPMTYASASDLKAAVARSDVVIIQGHLIEQHHWLRTTDKLLVADIYDPFHLEVLEQARDLAPNDRRVTTRLTVEILNEQLSRGDFFLCASEKQRDFWLGQLTAVGRINPATYDQHENLQSLIAIAPFGIDEEPPVHTTNVLRGVVPGIGANDKVILWGGGVYNWFDPLTLLHAVDKLRNRLPEVRLFFMGMNHPNPLVPAMQMAYRARALADDLDLVGTHVFFNDGWVDYEERHNYLLESDVGVSTHLDHVETAFSFRTRILDYLWASLPVVASDGDGFADVIRWRDLGLVVPPGDVDALVEALYALLADDERRAKHRAAIAEYAPEMHWSKVLAPLLEFCRHPTRAADLADPRQRVMIGDPLAQAMWGRRGWKHTARVGISHIRHRELGDLMRKLRMRIRYKLSPNSAGPGGRTDTF